MSNNKLPLQSDVGFSTAGNVASGNVLSDNYLYANGQPVASYNNADVSTYLAGGTNTDGYSTAGDVAANNVVATTNLSSLGDGSFAGAVSVTGNVTADHLLGNIANATGKAANAVYADNAGIATTAYSVDLANVAGAGNVAAINLNGSTTQVLAGDGTWITPAPGYSNADVATYLASGNLTTDIVTTGNVSAAEGTFSGNLGVAGNLTVAGNLNYQDVTDLVVGDPLIYVGANNTANIVDLGMIVAWDNGTYQHGGWVRDASDGTWKLFGNVTQEPTTTVDFTDAVYQSMLAGAISSTGNITGSYIFGNISQSTGLGNIVPTNLNANGATFLAGNGSWQVPTQIVNGTTNLSLVSNSSLTGTVAGTRSIVLDTDNNTVIGRGADYAVGKTGTVVIGSDAGSALGGYNGVAIGTQAGSGTQGDRSVAVGFAAGSSNQGDSATAIGPTSGMTNQGRVATALGVDAGKENQGDSGIAIGEAAGLSNQGANAIAIGTQTANNQGAGAISIGALATANLQAANSIALNATAVSITASNAGFYVAPVRNDTGNVTNAIYYNTTTKEVTYGPAGGGGGSYGDANVSAYLASGNNTAGYTTTGNISANNFIANGTLTVTGTVGTGNISGANVISGITLLASNSVVAGATVPVLPNSAATFGANVNSYAQVTFQNLSNGADATTDVVLTASNGNDTTNFIDVGVIGSGYDNATPTNSLGNIVFAADGYVYAQGNVGNTLQPGGNLAIGTTVASKTVKIFAGGNTASNIVATFANTGVSVAGNITGNYILGNGAFLTGISGGGTPTAIVNGTSNVTIAASAGNVLFNVNGNTAGVIGTSSVYLGYQSGQTTPGQNAVAVGYTAGQSTQGFSSIAIGYATASLNQGQYAAAVGALAGGLNQGNLAVAVGYNSGSEGQGANSIAIGQRSGYTSLGANAIAIGSYAGYLNQGANSIAIGANAIAANASINSITLNATNANITVANQGLYVAPVRNDTGNITNSMYYNTTTKEITYGPIPGATLPQSVLSGNVTLAANQAGSFLYSTTSTAASVTIPSNANVAFAVGTTITIVLQGTGSLELTPEANVNVYLGGNATAGTRTISPYGVATLLQVAADTWFINGTGVY